MRVKSTILVTSGKSESLGVSSLDHAIQKLRQLGQTNIIVVLGPDGDQFLSYSKHIENCEIIFDPNYEGELFSGVKSGLAVAPGASFVLPLETDIPDEQIWRALDSALLNAFTDPAKPDLFRVVTREGDSSVFPQLITLQGQKTFSSMAASTKWENPEPAKVQRIPTSEAA
jgi:hypothetical protein